MSRLPASKPAPSPALCACLICCGPTSRGFAHCFACRAVARLLKLPLTPVLPVRLCPVPGPLYTVLLGYKESPIDEARERFTLLVERLFGTFFAEHGDCLSKAIAGGVDLVVPVPSSSRPGRASLERADGVATSALTALGAGTRWAPSMLRRSEGEIGHMRPNAHVFSVPRSSRSLVSRSRVLLLDDTYVSGSRAQSAAAALRLSGARSVLIVPAGRVVRPERFRAHAAFFTAEPAGNGHGSRCLARQTGAGKE